jgi:toxin ParE1/3/4
MPGFTLTKKAKADLMEIGRYTQFHWGRDQRDKYLSMLDACFRQLSANPLHGSDCSDIRSGYRKINAGSHIIFYRQTCEGAIEIVRVLHGRMDIEKRI